MSQGAVERPQTSLAIPYAAALGLTVLILFAEGKARRREHELLEAIAVRDRSLKFAGEEQLRLQRALAGGLPGLVAGLGEALEDALEEAEVEAEEVANDAAGVDPSAE